MKHLISAFFTILWLIGIVYTKGFGLIVLAIFIPPYAWYVVIERAMHFMGLV